MSGRANRWLCLGALLTSLAAYGEGTARLSSADEVVRSMREARQSAGFEIRVRLSDVRPDDNHSATGQLSVIGEFDPEGGRLVTRRISGVNVTALQMTAEVDARGRVRVVQSNAEHDGAISEADAFAAEPYPGLFIWDMLAPWWMWPQQTVKGIEEVAGTRCLRIVSRTTAIDSPIRSVASCVDMQSRLALQTLLIDAHEKVVRRIDVERVVQRSSAAAGASRMRITGTDGKAITAEIYSGDQHHENTASTFSALRLVGAAASTRRGTAP